MKNASTDLHFVLIGIVDIDQNFQKLQCILSLSKRKMVKLREVHLQCHEIDFKIPWRTFGPTFVFKIHFVELV